MAASVKRLYLTLYNWTVLFGWLQVLYFALKTLKEQGHEHVYSAAETPLLFAQTAAVLEILHGLVGLVRSPITATLPQIGSRLFLVWGILWSFPEIIRYSFFGFKEAFGFAPSWLLWLRYSSFLVLYPTGISSEASEKYCLRMPNTWNSSFDFFYLAIVALGIYVPGMNKASFLIRMSLFPTCSPHMYSYMLAQRKKALAKSKTA
ncbi:hypothetical protein TSUD_191050 [Trifolium subterraneum]|uniref:Very-long-chain (3R)-3-hydroxyacyl-CoA dehydratase n=1 Tax=Trifolium subterraneum TaxID=3900 RepID=A0A2Z6NPE0_TRISU|nr:hypothetical protein TSUD_191050 [Trifolium subterraneum]